MSKRRQLNGGFLFVHKHSMTDAISVDRGDRSDGNLREEIATQGLGGGR